MDEILVMIELVEDFFEVDSGEKEGEGWWALMLGVFMEDSIEFFWIFGAVGIVGAMLPHPWVI